MAGVLSEILCGCGLRLWNLKKGDFIFTWCGKCDGHVLRIISGLYESEEVI